MTPSASRSLTALPTELLLEIVSHHSSFDSLTSLERLDRFDSEQRQVRRQVLLYLSQSCSALRAVFIRPLWERVDISRPNFHDADIRNELATRIFPYIKYVHVSLRLWSPKKTKQFKLLVEFLLALPNLTSLRIRWQLQFKVGLQGRGDSKLFSAFADVSLPSVTSLSVSDNLHPIFRAFPNVTTLACPSILAGSDALRPAIECFPYLDALVGLRIYRHTAGQRLEFDAVSIAEFARHFPRLRMLCITNPIPCNDELQPSLALLRAFTHLSELTFFARSDKNIFPLEVLLARGMDILRESTSLDAKVLRVWSDSSPAGLRLVCEERC